MTCAFGSDRHAFLACRTSPFWFPRAHVLSSEFSGAETMGSSAVPWHNLACMDVSIWWGDTAHPSKPMRGVSTAQCFGTASRIFVLVDAMQKQCGKRGHLLPVITCCKRVKLSRRKRKWTKYGFCGCNQAAHPLQGFANHFDVWLWFDVFQCVVGH